MEIMPRRIVMIFVTALLLLTSVWPYGAWTEEESRAEVMNPIIPPSEMPGADSRPPSGAFDNPEDGQAPMTDIHDIKPPAAGPADPKALLYLLAGASGATLVIVLFLLWKNRRRKLKSGVVERIAPDARALLALNEFGELDRIDGQAFYFRLTAILRRYMAERFGINAPEMTTEELLPRLDALGIPRELMKPLRDLFQGGDVVKYARGGAVVSRMTGDLDTARNFIEKTTPVEVETEPGEVRKF